MAELVDALASGASVLRDVEVQVLSRVPYKEDRIVVFFVWYTEHMPHIHTEPGQHDTTVCAFILRVTDQPRLLFHQHKHINTLLPVGGHVELNETPWQALVREVGEESGYESSQLEALVPAWQFDAAPGVQIQPNPYVLLTHGYDTINHYHNDLSFLVYVNDKPLGQPSEGESSDLRWLTFEDIVTLGNTEMKENVRMIAKGIFELDLDDWRKVPAQKFLS